MAHVNDDIMQHHYISCAHWPIQ